MVSQDVGVAREIAAAVPAGCAMPVDWVGGAAEAIAVLGRSSNSVVLVLADQRLADGTAFDVFRYVRRDSGCPYPGIALALLGSAVTEADIRRSALMGCLNVLGRPIQPEALARGLSLWPLDRTDFIVSGSYTGPDRRRASRQRMVERRTVSGPAEQTVASTGLGFDIRPSTTVFRFRRMATDDRDPALAVRNGLTRDAIEPARSHVRLKKDQAIAMLGVIQYRMDDAFARLTESPDREGLKRLNGVAREAAALTETRGLQLVGAIVRGLIGHTGGQHAPGGALLGILRAHLVALRKALDAAIADDGGPAGRQILATLRSAEEAFWPGGGGAAEMPN